MTLAKTCRAIAMFQLFHYCAGRKLNLILKLKVATLNE